MEKENSYGKYRNAIGEALSKKPIMPAPELAEILGIGIENLYGNKNPYGLAMNRMMQEGDVIEMLSNKGYPDFYILTLRGIGKYSNEPGPQMLREWKAPEQTQKSPEN